MDSANISVFSSSSPHICAIKDRFILATRHPGDCGSALYNTKFTGIKADTFPLSFSIHISYTYLQDIRLNIFYPPQKIVILLKLGIRRHNVYSEHSEYTISTVL